MLPYAKSNVKKDRKSIDKFGGLNRTVSKYDGELTDCINTSGRHYPALSSRKKRGTLTNTDININGVAYKDRLIYTGTKSDAPQVVNIYNGDKSAELSTTSDTTKKRSIASNENKILIVPDNKVYDTNDNSVYNIEYSKTITSESARETAKTECNTKTLYNITDYIGEITSKGIVSSRYSENSFSSYLMTFEDIEIGDIVHLSMNVSPREYTDDTNYKSYVKKMAEGVDLKITNLEKTKYTTKQGTVTRITSVEFGENVLDMGGFPVVVIMSATLSRRIPPLEHICSLNNRVWGVYDNTIHCSKLGDCGQWYDYSADSYGTLPTSCFSAQVDSNGEFTAIIPYGGSVVAFKENCLHKIYGSDPNSYTLSTINCKGVKKGCENTLVALGNALYYMGIDGVYTYTGTLPELISKKPDLAYAHAICAGTDGKNYYLCVKEDNSYVIYTYYPESKSWHRENTDIPVYMMIYAENKLFGISDTQIIVLSGEEKEENFRWRFSLEFNENMYYTKCYDKILINYRLKQGGEFTLHTICDGNTHQHHISPEFNHSQNSYSVITLPLTGCRDFKLVFEGKGEFILKNITREYVITPEETSSIII